MLRALLGLVALGVTAAVVGFGLTAGARAACYRWSR